MLLRDAPAPGPVSDNTPRQRAGGQPALPYPRHGGHPTTAVLLFDPVLESITLLDVRLRTSALRKLVDCIELNHQDTGRYRINYMTQFPHEQTYRSILPDWPTAFQGRLIVTGPAGTPVPEHVADELMQLTRFRVCNSYRQ